MSQTKAQLVEGLNINTSAPADALVIDSSGRLLVGATSGSYDLEVKKSGNVNLLVGSTNSNGVALILDGDSNGDGSGADYADITHTTAGDLQYRNLKSGVHIFQGTSSTERMRIKNDGTVLVGQTADSFGVKGHILNADGRAFHTVEGNAPLWINRQTNDGDLLKFYAQNVQEGAIVVSGTSVTLSGAHLSRWSQLPGGAARSEILRGSVLSNLDEMCEWGTEDNEQQNRMKVSDTEGDKNVSGVFQSWDDDDDVYTNDFYCAMTGDFVIRIAQGTTVERGDLLMSAGDGTAKPQDDDIVRSKTIAKVTSTTVSTTYSDNSYCVPCVLMAC